MEYVQLGPAGVRISRLCLGTMNAGMHPEEADEIVATIHAALDSGINFLDTADVYGRGRSEEVVGRAIHGRRDSVVLATKVFGAMSDDPNDRGTSRRHIKQACEASLRRLAVDSIDLYYLHVYDSSTPLEESLEALDDLICRGLVHYVGVSNFAAWQTVDAVATAERRQLASRPVANQLPVNMLDRRVEAEQLPMAQAHGVALLPWSPLAGGALSERYASGAIPAGARLARTDQWGALGTRLPRAAETIARLAQLAQDAGAQLAEVALAWLLRQPGVTAPVIGPRNRTQLEAAIRALELALDDMLLAEVDSIVPPATAVLPMVA